MLKDHLDKNNLHHAYLLEGARAEILPEVLDFIKSIGVKIAGNPDFINIETDSFKVEDARNLKSMALERSNDKGKKVILVSTNSFLLDAQNSLLKMFEEPIENTHFFLIVPDTNSLLKTFVSRFYLISSRQDLVEELKDAEKFIKMPPSGRMDFIKELLVEAEEEDEEGNEILALNSPRSKSLKFLNAVESVLHKNSVSKRHFDPACFQHIFKVREFLRMPGSSTKTLMESVALILPNF